MLHWRILLSVVIVSALVGLCWVDHVLPVPGVVLLPVALLFAVAGSGEILALAEAAGLKPSRRAVYFGNVLIVAGGWVAVLCRDFLPGSSPDDGTEVLRITAASGTATLLALAAGVLLVFAAEMRRYEKPGGVTAAVAAGVFALVYVGFLLSFAVQLRLIWGLGALISMLIVVKMGDVGAYTVGRLIGRHKMAPVLSPGKTIEGAFGALLFGCAASWATFQWLVPLFREDTSGACPVGWLIFGLVVAGAGMLGDLAESLIKRDAGRKDSSRWMPGFGGVLDLLDSILFAAPVAYACWALGLVG